MTPVHLPQRPTEPASALPTVAEVVGVSSSITRVQLAVVRDSSAYTDRVRLRDFLGAGGPPGVLAVSP